MPLTSLSALPLLTSATITAIDAPESTRASLLALGVMEGMEVMVRHRGPFGGSPLAIDLQGHMLALRVHDAAHIMVQPIKENT